MTLLVSHQGGGEASVRSTQSGWVRWAGHRAADHPVLPCSPAVLLVRGARPPAAAPTSEEPPERPPWETPHAASPQLHELHETHSVTQVSGHAPPGVGPGPAWVDAGQPPFRPPGLLGNAPQVGEMGWVPLNSREDSTFSKMQLSCFESSWVSAVSPPSKQRLKALGLPSLTALSLWWRAVSSSGSRLLAES